MRKLFLLTTAIIFTVVSFTACSDLTQQERQARATIKARFKQAPDGDSYKPMAWGRVEVNAPCAGTGTKNLLFDEETGTPPSPYSMTHRLRMRNGFGIEVTFDIRVFFTDESCRKWAGMEYMATDDPNRYLLRK